MNWKELHWCLGFFESQASFMVNIGLPKSKNVRYVVFKPVVSIANTDDYQVNHIKKLMKLQATAIPKKRKEKEHKDVYALSIQNFNDIDRIIEILGKDQFVSKIKQNRFEKFLDCYDEIKKVGHIHTEWKDVFEEIIIKKLLINSLRGNIDKNRFSGEQWKKKIQEHLIG